MNAARSILLAAILCPSLGCSEAEPSQPLQTKPETSLEVDAGAPPRSEACLLQDAKFQAALDSKRNRKKIDLLLAVDSSECGMSFYSSGPTVSSAHHLVRVGSITKTYVAVAALSMMSEGKLSLDDKASNVWKELPAKFASVNVRQLLQHTSGIPNYTESSDWQKAVAANPKQTWTPDQLIMEAAKKDLAFSPGSKWEYSNTNYILLGKLLETVDREPISSVVRKRVLVPAGLNETFFDGEESIPSASAWVPGLDARGTNVTHTYDPSMAWSAGAMVASTADLTRFVTLVGTGALTPPAFKETFTKGVSTGQSGLTYGLGVMLGSSAISGGFGSSIGHGGDIFGYHSMAMSFPTKKTTIVGISCSDTIAGEELLVVGLETLSP